MNHRKFIDGWAAWLLTLAAALPTAVTIGLASLAFSGYWDSGPALSRSATDTALLAYRWSSFWFSSPAITTLPLMGLLPLFILAITAVMNRPRTLLLTSSGRNAAAAVGGVTVISSLIEVAGFVAQLARLLPMHTWAGSSPSELVTFAPFAVLAITTTILSVVVTAVLWRVKGPAEQSVLDEAHGVAVVGVADEEEIDRPVFTSEVADARPGTLQPGTLQPGTLQPGTLQPGTLQPGTLQPGTLQPGTLQPARPLAMPTPSAADLDLYRR